MKYLIIAFVFLSFSATGQGYVLEDAGVAFKIRNAGITVDGTFDSITLDMSMERKKVESMRISGKIFAASIHTGIGIRDKHLRNEDYFDVDKYPWLTMELEGITSSGNDEFTGVFKLTIKDHTMEITFPVEYELNRNSISLTGSFELDRQQFGLGDDSLILSDEVNVTVNATFTRQGSN